MKATIIKYGGAAMNDAGARLQLLKVIADLANEGSNIALVHGGGPEIERMFSRLKITSEKVHGLRVTDADSMEVVEMVLSGKVNKNLSSTLQALGAPAIGLSGRDGGLFVAEKKIIDEGDLGFVGTISKTDIKPVQLLLTAGFVPVISSIADDGRGQAYNINADEAAASLATGLKAEKLLLLTDVPGVLSNYPDPDSRIPVLTCAKAEKLLAGGCIDRGMIPKIRSSIEVVRSGVRAAYIIDGRSPETLREVIRGNTCFGTMIVQ